MIIHQASENTCAYWCTQNCLWKASAGPHADICRHKHLLTTHPHFWGSGWLSVQMPSDPQGAQRNAQCAQSHPPSEMSWRNCFWPTLLLTVLLIGLGERQGLCSWQETRPGQWDSGRQTWWLLPTQKHPESWGAPHLAHHLWSSWSLSHSTRDLTA